METITVNGTPYAVLKLLGKGNAMKDIYYCQIKQIAATVSSFGLNIDYFPTNFIVCNQQIYYIDYERNLYMEQWDFENWGCRYWSKTPEFITYMTEETQSL